jgi:FO synthase
MTKSANPISAPSMTDDEAGALAHCGDLTLLMSRASALRDLGHGAAISYSRKVFIPLTHLCRDVCHYCTFAKVPRRGASAYLSAEQVLEIARAGERAGCHEALFTLGDKPELRYAAARDGLARLGYASTHAYLAAMCELVLRETSLLPHVNPGVMTREDIAMLRRGSVSQGIMLENVSARLSEKGQVHYGSPDKHPDVRLETIRLAGEAQVPFTSGILIGIGETRAERIASLLALRALHQRYGHIQEIIIQNFRAKPNTKLARAPEPDLEDLLWTAAVARLIFGATMNLQAPPNLTPEQYPQLIAAGINDWGGVSPVTPDHVNPEAPWPQIDALRRRTEAAGKMLVERLAVYPAYAQESARWQDPGLATRVLRATDGQGFARTDAWSPGELVDIPCADRACASVTSSGASDIEPVLARAGAGETLTERQVVTLFQARGAAFEAIRAAADALRQVAAGDTVRYVVNRNINYTNVCYFKCKFCAFSKGKLSENLRGAPYDLALEEVARRAAEAWSRGATEVCMQGGIHPDYTGETYLALTRAVKTAAPGLHIHAFSPLEITQGAKTLGIPVAEFLTQLREAGLGTLPGTAAEILDDEVRAVICPDKLSTREWLNVMETAHGVGFRTTATIMFGHVERYEHWARHLLRIRELQARSHGFTEFVPLPFVHKEAPMYLQGRARKGPTFREVILMHAVARLVLHPLIPNIQASWVKLGGEGVQACLRAGANDLGGTLMNESISRAAGTEHGQELPPREMEALIGAIGRTAQQRTTLYQPVAAIRREQSFVAAALAPIVQTPATKYARIAGAHARSAGNA